MTPPRRTRIVATLGPATDPPGVLGALVAAGLDVARLNASHGSAEDHRRRAREARAAARRLGADIALLVDLPGPKIRLGPLAEPRRLETGARVVLAPTRTAPGDALPVDHAKLAADVAPGDPVLLADGTVRLEVVAVRGDRVACRVLDGGLVRSRAGLNLPSRRVSAHNPTAADMRALGLALELGADWIAQSFVQDGDDVRRLKRRMAALGGSLPVMAKIEKPRAVETLDDVLDASDGVMVARGDLGVECAPEAVPLLQKRIIRAANALGLPVVTATQMLESMVGEPRPTRAEASDVANAILDGTDAVMLSAETAVGAHPVAAVRMMDAIARTTEESEAWQLRFAASPGSDARLGDLTEAVAHAAVSAARQARAAAILVHSVSGSSALRLARLRPGPRVVALTPDPAVARRLRMTSGVEPLVMKAQPTTDLMILRGLDLARRSRVVRRGDVVVIVAGETPLEAGSNLMRVVRA